MENIAEIERKVLHRPNIADRPCTKTGGRPLVQDLAKKIASSSICNDEFIILHKSRAMEGWLKTSHEIAKTA